MSLKNAIADIESGPQGPAVGAFFDFDGTLIDGFSAAEYFKDRIRKREITKRELLTALKAPLKTDLDAVGFKALFQELMTEWAGYKESEMRAYWQRLFVERVAKRMYHEGFTLVKAHLKAGHTVAIASSATRYQIEGLAEEYGIKHILASKLEVKRGVLTGQLSGDPAWGANKAAAVKQFAKKQTIDLSQSYGYANGDEDIDFLNSVGRATAINPDRILRSEARLSDWPIIDFTMRRRAPLKALAGTVGCYSAMTATMLAGLAYNRVYQDPRRAVDLIASVGSDVGFALAGVKINVINEHNLWKARPAVFIINHQSKLDFFIFCNIIRRGATGVVKKEAANAPIIGPFLKMAEMSFIDRSDTQSAIETLKPVVERLKKGLSVGIAPEGTRSYSPNLGRFKKGAFYVARQAGVPIVPVVLRNSGEIQARNDQTIRAGTVDICVLEPIDVSAWTDADMSKNVEEVRQQFVDTLSNWPDASNYSGAVTKL